MIRYLKHIAVLILVAFFCGCEDDDDIDHTPPYGMGALCIYNDTSSDIDVYINGAAFSDVNDRDDRAWDLDPGTYRLVLNEDDGDRNYSCDIDILTDTVTELTVTESSFYYDSYNVDIYYDD